MWKALKLTAPANVADIKTGLSRGALPYSVTATAGSLALTALDLPAGTGADTPGRARLETLLNGNAGFLALTPYNLGERKGDQAYLTPTEALTHLQERLMGIDSLRSAVLILLLPAESPAALANSLAGLCRAYPMPELEKLLRRAGALATLETDKFVIPRAPDYPATEEDAPTAHPQGRAGYSGLASLAAVAEAVQRALDAPLSKLQAFAQKRLAREAERQTALREWEAALTGSFPYFAAYLEGLLDIRQISSLSCSSPVADSFKSCAALCWWGRPASLEFMKELFGV